MVSNTKFYRLSNSFYTESNALLPELTIAYNTYGEYNKSKRVVWVCHALTANSDVADWWKGLVGDHNFFNPEEYFIVCANVLGSCYGSTGPLSSNTETGKPFFNQFPVITIKDMVNAHILLRHYLQINEIEVLIGGSLGGQQVLEWAVTEPNIIKHIVPIATNACHSAWGIAFNEAQRMAIVADHTWGHESEHAAYDGLKAARAIAMLSYRHYNIYQATQTDATQEIDFFKAASYQQYQGEKLARRFNAYSYYYLSKAMDSHNIARNRADTLEQVLQTITAKACCVGLNTDILFPRNEQQFLAAHIPNAQYYEIDTLYGHDGFLLEFEQLTRILHEFLVHSQ